MNKWLYVLFMLFSVCSNCVFAQEQKEEQEVHIPPTKFDEFVSRSGVFIRTEDYALTRIVLQLGTYAETRVRKVTIGSEVKVYYQVISGPYVGSVSIDDFPHLLKAFETLKEQVKTYSKTPADYFENKYVDPDGLQLGYFVEGKRPAWAIKTHRLSSRILYVKDPFTLEESLKGASIKFKELN